MLLLLLLLLLLFLSFLPCVSDDFFVYSEQIWSLLDSCLRGCSYHNQIVSATSFVYRDCVTAFHNAIAPYLSIIISTLLTSLSTSYIAAPLDTLIRIVEELHDDLFANLSNKNPHIANNRISGQQQPPFDLIAATTTAAPLLDLLNRIFAIVGPLAAENIVLYSDVIQSFYRFVLILFSSSSIDIFTVASLASSARASSSSPAFDAVASFNIPMFFNQLLELTLSTISNCQEQSIVRSVLNLWDCMLNHDQPQQQPGSQEQPQSFSSASVLPWQQPLFARSEQIAMMLLFGLAHSFPTSLWQAAASTFWNILFHFPQTAPQCLANVILSPQSPVADLELDTRRRFLSIAERLCNHGDARRFRMLLEDFARLSRHECDEDCLIGYELESSSSPGRRTSDDIVVLN